MKIRDILEQLVNFRALSGEESKLAKFLAAQLNELGLEATCDSYGNVIGRLNSGLKNAKTLLLEAHLDQIGLMVSGIEEDGIKFVNLGGVDQRILPGMEVMIQGKESIFGIIGACQTDDKKDEETKTLKVENYRIDTGLSVEEMSKMISIGDFIYLGGEATSLQNGIVSGPAMDNRAGIVSILDSLYQLKEKTLSYDIMVLFSTQEELGLHGAYAGVRNQNIDCAIVIDVTHGTTPDTQKETGVFPLGSGAVICRGPNFHYSYTKQLITLAKQQEIPHAIEVASAESGTTAWAIQTANGGIPVMLISVPLRYMHTNVETLDVGDIKEIANLLCSVATGGVELV